MRLPLQNNIGCRMSCPFAPKTPPFPDVLLSHPTDGTAGLVPMVGACVHVNGVSIPAAEELLAVHVAEDPNPGMEASSTAGVAGETCNALGRTILNRNCRVVFGRRHFFRLDIKSSGSGDWFGLVILGMAPQTLVGRITTVTQQKRLLLPEYRQQSWYTTYETFVRECRLFYDR